MVARALVSLASFVALSTVVRAQAPAPGDTPLQGPQPVANQQPSDPSYSCPATCVAPACVCASTKIPGGLTADQTPMFVTLTADDAVQPDTWAAFEQVLNSTVNPNGCNLPFTSFTSIAWTDMWLVTQLHSKNHEIAVHTINHPDLALSRPAAREQEIVGSFQVLNNWAGIPKKDLQGFRHPFLSFNKDTFDIVAKAGFKYESSVTLDPILQPYWPHTLDYGFAYYPQPCLNCTSGPSMRYPGLWEIPMYNLITNSTPPALWTSMDPIISPQLNDYDIAMANLKASFDLHYKTKLPFGLYQHLAQLVAWGPDVQVKKIQWLKDFVQWAQTNYKDVWFVTNQQLIKWIQAPVPASKMLEFLPCVGLATDKSNKEVCDGIDNNGDGTVDEGLMENCQITDQYGFMSCFGCPTIIPNITQPVPPFKTAARKLPVDAGCDNGVWDPVGGACVNLVRATVKLPAVGAANGTNGTNPTTGSNGSGSTSNVKNSASAVPANAVGAGAIVALISSLL
ncbi:uncharacterized protein EV422DRAFT_525897 [Fimicolochytrium jonesii]|uniref:uncharacterized protein n=1 Tax=Fimicolochytrium jonesii TaxID=1396493 RepID=UPI0022FE77E3|nr:uncharacterized protein EV422DRAFT_525897 [Fimicolochytrium jonesii]KAI8822156.1 hypothetical protein EV422DRAFT_525897 [Fimicolochytrium jonesii]